MTIQSTVSSLRYLPVRWKEMAPSVRRKRILICTLIILHISPLWVFKYLPTQDGPAHVYNSYVLSVFHEEESTRLREYYKLNLTLFPNWIAHICMALLMKVFPPLIAEKILLSAIIGLFPLSLFYLLGAVHEGKNLYGFLGFLFSDHYLLHMGFYSFFAFCSTVLFRTWLFHQAQGRIERGQNSHPQSVVHFDLLQPHPFFSTSHSFANSPIYHIVLSKSKTGRGTSGLYAAAILHHGKLFTRQHWYR